MMEFQGRPRRIRRFSRIQNKVKCTLGKNPDPGLLTVSQACIREIPYPGLSQKTVQYQHSQSVFRVQRLSQPPTPRQLLSLLRLPEIWLFLPFEVLLHQVLVQISFWPVLPGRLAALVTAFCAAVWQEPIQTVVNNRSNFPWDSYKLL